MESVEGAARERKGKRRERGEKILLSSHQMQGFPLAKKKWLLQRKKSKHSVGD